MREFMLAFMNTSNTAQDWSLDTGLEFPLAPHDNRHGQIVVNDDFVVRITVDTEQPTFAAAVLSYTYETDTWTLDGVPQNVWELGVHVVGGPQTLVTVKCSLDQNEARIERPTIKLNGPAPFDLDKLKASS